MCLLGGRFFDDHSTTSGDAAISWAKAQRRKQACCPGTGDGEREETTRNRHIMKGMDLSMPSEIPSSSTEAPEILNRDTTSESTRPENPLATRGGSLTICLQKHRAGLLSLLIIALTLIGAEFVFRALLFRDASLMKPLQKAGLYADCTSSDDYWKLLYLFGKYGEPATTRHQRYNTFSHYDSQLGWVNSLISPETYRHADAVNLGSKTPILLYGDSFAQCRTPPGECFQGLINGDTQLNSRYCLLNYGVWGYGLDQIYLLYRKTIDLYTDPVVIISLLPEDMDRGVLTVRDAPKPYFVVNDGKLALKGVPVDPDLAHYYEKHPPEIRSYLAALVHNLLLDSLRPSATSATAPHWRTAVQRIPEKKEINQRIIKELCADLRQRGVKFVFLVFDSPEQVFEPLQWRDQFLFHLLAQQEVPYISARTVIRQYESEETFSCQMYRFSCHDHHPSSVYNQVLARQIVDWMRVQRLLGDPAASRAGASGQHTTRVEGLQTNISADAF